MLHTLPIITRPPATQIVFNKIEGFADFYLVLRCSDQQILDDMFEAIFQHQDAISKVDNLLPIEVIPFVTLLEEYKKMETKLNELLIRLQELRNKIELLPHPN